MDFRSSFSPKLIQIAQICLVCVALIGLFLGHRGLALVALAIFCATAARARRKPSGWKRLNDLRDTSGQWIRDPTNIRYPIGEYRARD